LLKTRKGELDDSPKSFNLPESVTEALMQQGLGALPEMIKVMINNAMLEERTRYLKA